MGYIKTSADLAGEEINLFYQDWGTGQPVVFIHGWPLSHEMWEYQLVELPKYGFRCIAYDRRGFGKSDKPWSGYDYDTLASDLNSLLEKLDLNHVTLVGFSMGGGEVVRYISKYGTSRIAKAILISSVAPYLLKTDDNPDGVDKEAFDGFVKNIEDDRPEFLNTFGKQFYGVNLISKPVSKSILEWNQMLALQGSPQATTACIRSFSETDFRSEMHALNAIPTLIIHGSSDSTVPIEPTGNQAADLVPNAQYIVYDGAPHGLFYTEKGKLNTDLLQFINQKTEAGAML